MDAKRRLTVSKCHTHPTDIGSVAEISIIHGAVWSKNDIPVLVDVSAHEVRMNCAVRKIELD